MFSPLLLLFSIIIGIATSSSSLSTYQSLQQQYYELLASYEDDDINSPPGPTNGWPHTQPYTTTYNDLVSYNNLLEQRMYVTYQEEYFATYNGDNNKNSPNENQGGQRNRSKKKQLPKQRNFSLLMRIIPSPTLILTTTRKMKTTATMTVIQMTT